MRRRHFAAAIGALGLGAAGAASADASTAGAKSALAGERPPTTDDYFGMHFHRLLPDPGVRSTTRWPQAQIGSLRLWDSTTRWGDLAPRRDRWDFDRLDAHVALAETNGVPVLYTLGSTPRWASARPDEPGPYGPGCAAEPRVLGDWHDYVSRIAARYRGRIAAYEVWNEPYFSDFAADRGQPTFFSGSVAQMVEMTRIARDAIKSADPEASLATPGFVNGTHRLDRFLSAGGAGAVDIVAYHFYARDAAQYLSQIDEVRAAMRHRSVAHLPLWNTECGIESVSPWPATPAMDPHGGAAARLAQFLILGAAARVGRFYYHAWDNDRTGMVDRGGVVNARGPAWRKARRWLLGSRLSRPEPLGDGAFRVDAVQEGRRYAMLWSEREAKVDLRLPTDWRIDMVETLLGGAHAARSGDSVPRRFALGPAPVRIGLARGLPS